MTNLFDQDRTTGTFTSQIPVQVHLQSTPISWGPTRGITGSEHVVSTRACVESGAGVYSLPAQTDHCVINLSDPGGAPPASKRARVQVVTAREPCVPLSQVAGYVHTIEVCRREIEATRAAINSLRHQLEAVGYGRYLPKAGARSHFVPGYWAHKRRRRPEIAVGFEARCRRAHADVCARLFPELVQSKGGLGPWQGPPPVQRQQTYAPAYGHDVRSTLNGNNGSWTNSDDVYTIPSHDSLTDDQTPRVEELTILPTRVISLQVDDVVVDDPLGQVMPEGGAAPPLVPAAVMAISELFGAEPKEINTARGRARVVWTSGVTLPYDAVCAIAAGPWKPHEKHFVQTYAEAPAVVLRRSAPNASSWTITEYLTHADAEAMRELTSRKPWLVRYSQMSLPTLLHLMDTVAGAPVGCTSLTLANQRVGRLRLAILRTLATAEPALYDAHIDHLPHKVVSWGVRVRDAALNGSNGSATNTDDVKGNGQKKHQKAKQIAKDVIKGAAEGGSRPLAAALGIPQAAPLLARAGHRIGGNAVDAVYRALGWGKYDGKWGSGPKSTMKNSVKTNSLLTGSCPPAAVEFAGEICSDVFSSDFVTTVQTQTSGTFFTLKLVINPGNQNLCPQAFSKTLGFELYKVRGLMLEFLTSYGPLASGSLGNLGFCFDPDSSSPAPTSLKEMSLREGYFQTVINQSANFFVECSPKVWSRPNYYIWGADKSQTSTSGVPSAYDCGVIYVGVEPAPAIGASADIGTLRLAAHWCVGRSRASSVVDGYAHFSRTTYTNAAPLGDSTTEVMGSSKTGVCTGVLSQAACSGTSLTFPGVGEGTVILITIRWAGTTGATIAYPSLGGANYVTLMMQAGTASGDEVSPLAGATGITACSRTITIRTSADMGYTPTVTLSSGTLPSTTQRVEIFCRTLLLGGSYGVNL